MSTVMQPMLSGHGTCPARHFETYALTLGRGSKGYETDIPDLDYCPMILVSTADDIDWRMGREQSKESRIYFRASRWGWKEAHRLARTMASGGGVGVTAAPVQPRVFRIEGDSPWKVGLEGCGLMVLLGRRHRIELKVSPPPWSEDAPFRRRQRRAAR